MTSLQKYIIKSSALQKWQLWKVEVLSCEQGDLEFWNTYTHHSVIIGFGGRRGIEISFLKLAIEITTIRLQVKLSLIIIIFANYI